jgi:hypothetical protein
MLIKRRSLGLGGLALMLLLALAVIGLGFGLWSKILTIDGIIRTGSVNAEFIDAFTDDDNKQDDPAFDFYDDGDCDLPPFDDDHDGAIDEDPIDGADNDGDGLVDEDPPGKLTSCDPKETGAEGENNLDHRYDKDVAECFARIIPDGSDNELQPGSQLANVFLSNAYPSYHCTAWLTIHNNGSIPIHLHSVSLLGKPATPCAAGVAPTPYDLDGDGAPDVEICVSGISDLDLNCRAGDTNCREFQLHPSQRFRMDLDIHVMQTARQNALLGFQAEVCWHQWNEEIGQCPAVLPNGP